MLIRGLQVALLMMAVPLFASDNRILIEDFTRSDRWEVHRFNGETDYRLVRQGERSALAAHCDGGASGLVWKRDIDLDRTPWLHWSWASTGPYARLDERSKSGDDYIARIYVVRSNSLLPWRSMAVNYVWSGSQSEGSTWPNAYTNRAQMFAIRGADGRHSASGSDHGWRRESRNVRADFEQAFGTRVDEIDVVALMSDCDDSRRSGRAWFDDIYFSAQPGQE